MCEAKIKTSAEIHFAQKLACNEKKIRDRSLKRLRRWLAIKSSTKSNAFSSQDMMKLWKGLFYCMWMSDKPLIQENLASMISKLIHCFSRKEYSFMFIDCFFQTMSREWFGLDKFRLEKFMMLVRRFLRESLEFLRKQKWMTDDIESLFQIMEKNVLSPQNDSTFLSLKLHVIDIFMDELAEVDREELTSDKMLNILTPFCTILASTESSALLFDTSKNIFQCLIYQHTNLISEGLSSTKEDFVSKTAVKDEQHPPIFNVDCCKLKELMFDFAKKENVKKMNRNVMYGLVKKLKDISEGINPFHRQVSEDNENKSVESSENESISLVQENHNSQKERSKRINEESTSFCTSSNKKKFKSAKGSGKKSGRKKILSPRVC